MKKLFFLLITASALTGFGVTTLKAAPPITTTPRVVYVLHQTNDGSATCDYYRHFNSAADAYTWLNTGTPYGTFEHLGNQTVNIYESTTVIPWYGKDFTQCSGLGF